MFIVDVPLLFLEHFLFLDESGVSPTFPSRHISLDWEGNPTAQVKKGKGLGKGFKKIINKISDERRNRRRASVTEYGRKDMGGNELLTVIGYFWYFSRWIGCLFF